MVHCVEHGNCTARTTPFYPPAVDGKPLIDGMLDTDTLLKQIHYRADAVDINTSKLTADWLIELIDHTGTHLLQDYLYTPYPSDGVWCIMVSSLFFCVIRRWLQSVE